MNVFEVTTVLVTVTALFGFINERYTKLPITIGVTLVAPVLARAALIRRAGLGEPVGKFFGGAQF